MRFQCSLTSPIRNISLALMVYLFVTSPAAAEKRIALIVGNSSYQNVPRLNNPANDARLMADTLRSLGFALGRPTAARDWRR
jgi:hypothetical protein